MGRVGIIQVLDLGYSTLIAIHPSGVPGSGGTSLRFRRLSNANGQIDWSQSGRRPGVVPVHVDKDVPAACRALCGTA